MASIIGSIITGFIVGGLGRLILPGDQNIGWLRTIGLGVIASFIVGLALESVVGDSWFISVAVSAVVAAGLLWGAMKQGWLTPSAN